MMLEVLRRRYRVPIERMTFLISSMWMAARDSSTSPYGPDELGITDSKWWVSAKSRLQVDQATGAPLQRRKILSSPAQERGAFQVNSPACFCCNECVTKRTFRVTYHKTLRQRQQLHSTLEDIPVW